MSTLEEGLKSMQQSMESMFEINQQILEYCAHMKVNSDQIMNHLDQPISTPSPYQVQGFHQCPQVEFNSNQEDTQPTREKTLEKFKQFSQQMLSDNVQHLARLDKLASEFASGQENESLSTQSIPGPTSSILKHIRFHEANKFKILRSDEQIDDHIDRSIHSIEMPFESTPSFHLNRI